MSYISLEYYLLVVAALIIYYILPAGKRWIALLLGSAAFYCLVSADKVKLCLFISTIILSYLGALYIERVTERRQKLLILWCTIILTAVPLLLFKGRAFLPFSGLKNTSLIVPVGLSFYTLQIIAYLADVYRGKTKAQRDPFKYALFISFFPQIIQGPIPRYEQLGEQLLKGNSFRLENIVRGCQLITWGFFLKLMIADKAAVAVNEIFDNYKMYAGTYVWVAGILYSLQLYTDFLSCTTIAQGVAGLFGIKIADNFHHPYFAVSVQDFWRRWHMSLSSWLKDYVYIPLGGSRAGKLRKYINLFLTFIVSGFWHGEGHRFIFWGILHACYQIFGALTVKWRDRLYETLSMPKGTFAWKLYRTIGTCFWVMIAWIIFRAEGLRAGLHMIRSMFTVYNPWILLNGALNSIMPYQQWELLAASLLVLFVVSRVQEKMSVRDWIARQHITIRWGLALGCIAVIVIFGTYGFGYDAQAFIYGGF